MPVPGLRLPIFEGALIAVRQLKNRDRKGVDMGPHPTNSDEEPLWGGLSTRGRLAIGLFADVFFNGAIGLHANQN
jgi:hypothetical protein